MAAVAERLGVGMATLYNHVRGQEELLRIAEDAVFDSLPLPVLAPTAHWAAWVTEYAETSLRALAAYPSVLIDRAQVVCPASLRLLDRAVASLQRHGLALDQALDLFLTVTDLVLGVGGRTFRGRAEESARGATGDQVLERFVREEGRSLDTLIAVQQLQPVPYDEHLRQMLWDALVGFATRRGLELPPEVPPADPRRS